MQKSHTILGIFFWCFPTYQTDDLLFIWLRIYTLVFLHIAASSNFCCLVFLYETNSPSLKTEIYCILPVHGKGRMMWGPQLGSPVCLLQSCSVQLPPAPGSEGPEAIDWPQSRPRGQLLVHKSWSLSKQRQQSFLQSTFYRSCAKLSHPLEAPHHSLFCDAVCRGQELRVRRR